MLCWYVDVYHMYIYVCSAILWLLGINSPSCWKLYWVIHYSLTTHTHRRTTLGEGALPPYIHIYKITIPYYDIFKDLKKLSSNLSRYSFYFKSFFNSLIFTQKDKLKLNLFNQSNIFYICDNVLPNFSLSHFPFWKVSMIK